MKASLFSYPPLVWANPRLATSEIVALLAMIPRSTMPFSVGVGIADTSWESTAALTLNNENFMVSMNRERFEDISDSNQTRHI